MLLPEGALHKLPLGPWPTEVPMRLIVALWLLMSTACATTPPAAEAMLEGRWNSTPSRAGNERKDECVFERNGKFSCMSTFWACQSCQGESILYAGTWRLDGSRLSRHITDGLEAGSSATDDILDMGTEAVTFTDGSRWLRDR